MKQTSLYSAHKAAGATLVPFAGWDMPVSYTGTVAEVAAVRQRAGLFDVSHMGEVYASGPEALAFLQYVTANDVTKLPPGKAQYSLLLNEQGGLIDDIIVSRLETEKYLVVLNAGCKDKDWDWLQAQAAKFPDLIFEDRSDETALLAVQGPQAVELVASLTGSDVTALKRFEVLPAAVSGIEGLVSRTGYTGEDGFEIFCAWDDAPRLWDVLVGAGALPAGLGARDVLRLEAAYPLYGHELDDTHLPAESGVSWAVKPKKGDFIGRSEVVGHPVTHKLVGLKMTERAIPREGYPVLNDADESVGLVTSGTYSPTVQAGVAMARLRKDFAEIGTSVIVDIRGRRAAATVVSLPFYRNGV